MGVRQRLDRCRHRRSLRSRRRLTRTLRGPPRMSHGVTRVPDDSASHLVEIRGRHRGHQPYPVRRDCERVPRLVHGPGVNQQDHACSPPRTNALGSRDVRGQMYGMTMPWQQTIAQDQVDVPPGRPVEQPVRRGRRRQSQIHLDRVTLVGSNTRIGGIEGEALFVAAPHDPFELLLRHRLAVVGERRQQHLDLDPAGSIERDPYARGLVSQDQGQKPGGPAVVHKDIVRTTGEGAHAASHAHEAVPPGGTRPSRRDLPTCEGVSTPGWAPRLVVELTRGPEPDGIPSRLLALVAAVSRDRLPEGAGDVSRRNRKHHSPVS